MTTPTPRQRSLFLHGSVLGLAGAANRWSRRARTRRSSTGGSAVAIVVGWALLQIAERTTPHSSEWQQDHDDDTVQDLIFLVGSTVPSAAGRMLGRRLSRRLPNLVRGERLPDGVAVVASVATYDLFHTLLHRTLHEWGPGWTVHSVHHSPKRLYSVNATRFHWIETAIDAVFEAISARLVELTPDQEAAYLVMRSVYGQLQHANVDVDSGPLNRVFSTPDLHRWHHSEDYDEGDTNYGAITSVWDQLFGSYYHPDRPMTSELGVGRMPNFPTEWLELQRVPFMWDEIKERNADTWNVDVAAAR